MKKTPPVEPLPAGLTRRHWIAAAAALVAAGCGGGDGVDSGGTGTGNNSTISVGTITGFGSIVVNGVRYDDSAAAVTDDDGTVRSAADLRLGMRAAVRAGTPVGGRAVASQVTLRSELAGPLQAVDRGAGRLQVLGQRVDLVPTTVIEGGLAALAAGQDVAVYATLDLAQRRYVATRVEPRPGATFDKIRGVVDTLDLAAGTLLMGTLRVDWRAVAPADPATALAPGRPVALKLARTPATGTRVATALDTGAPDPGDHDDAEWEGRVTALRSTTSFDLDGVAVDARGAQFPSGSAGLVVGARVEAEGRLSGGVLVARVVNVEAGDGDGETEPFELAGSVGQLDRGAQTFVVRGVVVRWDAATRFEGGTARDLAEGRGVELRGALDAAGRVLATVIALED